MKRTLRHGIAGSEIAKARKAANLTQRALAAFAGLHVNSVKRLERLADIPLSSWHALGRIEPHLPTLQLPRPQYLVSERHPPRPSRYNCWTPPRAHHGQTDAPHIQTVRKADRQRCGARTRQDKICQALSTAKGRCRMHGGLSTGPKTEKGRRAISKRATNCADCGQEHV
jgi:hypothetical protein